MSHFYSCCLRDGSPLDRDRVLPIDHRPPQKVPYVPAERPFIPDMRGHRPLPPMMERDRLPRPPLHPLDRHNVPPPDFRQPPPDLRGPLPPEMHRPFPPPDRRPSPPGMINMMC